MTKKLIAFVLASSLCFGSASAVDVYEVDQDSRPLMMMSSPGVSTAAVEDSWYDYVLQNLEWIMADIDSIEDFSEDIALNTWDIGEFLYDVLDVLGSDADGTIAAMLSSSLEYLADTAGWLGVYDGGLQLNDLFSVLNTTVADFYSAVSDFHRIFDIGTAAVMGPYGIPTTINDLNLGGLLKNFSRGTASALTLSAGLPFLSWDGLIKDLPSETRFSVLFSSAMVGLARNINAISTGSYSVSLFNSDTAVSVNSSASTMGSMIHQYLDAMQDDLGALTYLYADSEAVKAKKDSASNSAAVLDGFLKPGSAGSVGVSDIGDAAEAVSGTKDLFDTGVSIGQAFDQLQGSGPLEFFTAQTAANLNTVPATYSDDDDFVHFYDSTNSEFFELIGKGGD